MGRSCNLEPGILRTCRVSESTIDLLLRSATESVERVQTKPSSQSSSEQYVLRPPCVIYQLIRLHLLQMHHTELTIHLRFALSEPHNRSNGLEFEHLETLFACLNAIRSWFDIWLEIPISIYPTLSWLFVAQLFRCIVILKRLSIFEHPDWNRGRIESTDSLSSIVDRFITKIRPGGGYSVEIFNEDIFPRMVRIFELARSQNGGSDAVNTMNGDMGLSRRDTTNGVQIDFIDDAWIRDILESWDYRFASKSYA